MDTLTAYSIGVDVNPRSPHEAANCATCMDYRPRVGADRCLRLPVNIDPGRHRWPALWCRRQDGDLGMKALRWAVWSWADPRANPEPPDLTVEEVEALIAAFGFVGGSNGGAS